MDLEYYEISVPDRNDSIMRVNLDEVYYNLRLTWNAYGGFWMLSIAAQVFGLTGLDSWSA